LLGAARPLEAALYRLDFEDGSTDAVYAALAAFQNDDGGFGHGLEPDLQTPNSSILATTAALQILRHIHAAAENPLVRGALAYMHNAYEAEQARWPLIPAEPATANDRPHAPWWSAGPDHPAIFHNYAVNPRADILGYLYQWPELTHASTIHAIEAALEFHYTQLDEPLDMNELLCTLRLLNAPALPEPLRAAAHGAVASALPRTVAVDAEAWESYSLQPLQVAPEPHALFAPALANWLDANLDFRIVEQQDDGSWAPPWNWGPLFPAAWPQARRAWQGILTLEALRSLRAYGRIAL
jgi:hypothetical protein